MRFGVVVVVVSLLPVAGCGPSLAPQKIEPFPEPVTHAVLAGHRCEADACKCRVIKDEADQAEATPPEEGMKRFELRVRSANGPAWVVVDDGVLFKSVERTEDCFYLDLAPGTHPVKLRGKAGSEAGGGVGLGLTIAEHQPSGPWWYDAFRFDCGVPGSCDKQGLQDWIDAVAKDRRKLRDYCGSSKIMSLNWETGRMPDAQYPEDVTVTFDLYVSDYQPDSPPGDEGCSAN